MKKSNFIALVLGTISCVLFALGMCMALIPEWDAFKPGIVLGCVGLFIGLIAIITWRKMEHKVAVQLSGKWAFIVLIGVMGALALGVGMCFSMVWDKMVVGIVIGLIGIVTLLSMVPLVKGLC